MSMSYNQDHTQWGKFSAIFKDIPIELKSRWMNLFKTTTKWWQELLQCLFILNFITNCLRIEFDWKRQPEPFKFDSRRHGCKAKPPAYDGPLAAKEITPDKRADSVNEKWPENLACWHKRIDLNACAAHDSFPLSVIFLFSVIKMLMRPKWSIWFSPFFQSQRNIQTFTKS